MANKKKLVYHSDFCLVDLEGSGKKRPLPPMARDAFETVRLLGLKSIQSLMQYIYVIKF